MNTQGGHAMLTGRMPAEVCMLLKTAGELGVVGPATSYRLALECGEDWYRLGCEILNIADVVLTYPDWGEIHDLVMIVKHDMSKPESPG
jgi:hypothetical protein